MERDIQEEILSELKLIKGVLVGTHYQPKGIIQRVDCIEEEISKNSKFIYKAAGIAAGLGTIIGMFFSHLINWVKT